MLSLRGNLMTWFKFRLTKRLSPFTGSRFGSSRNRLGSGRPLRLEFLEGRWVPSTLTPTTFADGGPGSGSLRDAVLQLNADAGTADDIIQLQAGTYALTIRNVGGRHETAGLTGDLNLNATSHRWIIQGAGSSGDNPTIIDASQLQDRVFQIVNPGTQVVLQDLLIQGGLAQDNGSDGALAGTTDALGGGIFNNGGDVTLDDVVLQNNVARGADGAARTANGYGASGGGIYSTGGALTLAAATITNNQASGGRGGDSSLTHYRAGAGGEASGAGLYASGGSLDISDSRIANNQATGGRGGDGRTYCMPTPSGSCNLVYLGGYGGIAQGGGLYVNGGSLTVASSTMASNEVTEGSAGLNGSIYGVSGGGGLVFFSNTGTATVTASALSGNSSTGAGGAGSGGGIENGGTLTVSNSTLSGNSANYGGGIYNSGTLTVSNSTLSGNSAGHGGGIYYYGAPGTLTVSNSTLSGNSVAGIFTFGGTLTLSNSTLSGNTGSGIYNHLGTVAVSNSTLSGNTGGGIYNDGTLAVSTSTLSSNSAVYGGGIYNEGTLTLSNSTLSGNSANGYLGGGGGIYNDYYGTLTLSNSTLSGNSATYFGGGIDTLSTGRRVTLTNVTLTANRANTSGVSVRGGGLYVAGSPVLHNTLIAGNFNGATGTTADDVYGGLNPGGDCNLIGDGTGMTGLSDGVNGNQVGSFDNPIDPLLGPLADNGGPTLTHALLSGSPAIDAGNNAYATDWDQRGPGYPRIVNGIIDIGAFEVQAPAASRLTRRRLPDPLPALGLPPPADAPGFLFGTILPGSATTPSVPRGIEPNQETPAGPQVVSGDQGLASSDGETSRSMVPRWSALEPIQAGGPNPDLSPEETGLPV
jgi:hypothetical protein